MPELRSGVRQARLRSKRIDDIPPQPSTFQQPEIPVQPTPARGGRRGGAGRGRGRAAAVARVTAVPVRPTVAGRGRGVRLIDLDPDQPCENLPGPAAGIAKRPILNLGAEGQVDKNMAMNGVSAEKLAGAEDETAPMPERVCLYIILFLSKFHLLLCT